MNADDSARLRDLLASNRTLLAWVRTAIAFAGLGFVVAKFGFGARYSGVSAALGILMTAVGLLLTVVGLAQHRSVAIQVRPPPGAPRPPEWPIVIAATGCALACVLLTAYLAAIAA